MSRRVCVVLLFFVAILPTTVVAQDRSPREALAEKIVNDAGSQAEQADVERELTDTVARAMFKQLRSDSSWGPDSADWQRHYPGFLAAFRVLDRRQSGAGEQRIKTALAERLTESELAQIVAAQGSPASADLRSLMKELGMDFGSAIRIVGIVSTPALYSQAEKDALRARMAALKAREEELKAMKPRIDAALAMYRTPAFVKYQQVMAGVLRESLSQAEGNQAARKEIRDFSAAWRERVERP